MKLSDTSKDMINEFKNLHEFDQLNSLESEESELYDEESDGTEEHSNSSIFGASIEPYYDDERAEIKVDRGEDKVEDDTRLEVDSNNTIYSGEASPSSPRYISSQANETTSSSTIESDDDPNDPDYTLTQTHFTILLKKIFKKLAQLTQITTEFNRFRSELNTKLDGNHMEYEILVEDLMESVAREGSKQNRLVEGLMNELTKSKREAVESNVVKSEDIETKEKGLDQEQIGSRVEKLEVQLEKSPPSKVKLTKISITISVVLGVTLGLATVYYIKYYLKLY
jgi:hypothetical protein